MTPESRGQTAERLELHSIADRVEIAPGVLMPRLGVGTSHVSGLRTVESEIVNALELGYRSIDTATAYGNEAEIGKVLSEMDVPREELFVTSKVWPSDQGYERTLRALESTLRRLRFDYLDLYLIHWPEPRLTAETWNAFERARERGLVRAIGVSNFMEHDLRQLDETANTPPAINQIEFHPRLQRPALVGFCQSRGMVVEAWSPLMRGKVLDIPELAEIARVHGKSVAQVTLRWILQRGIVTVPKSVHPGRLQENAEIFDFSLSETEMAIIDALDRGQHES